MSRTSRTVRFATLLLAPAAAVACNADDVSARTAAPADSGATGAPAPVETRLTTPPGLTATKFATVSGARAIAVAPDGSIYISQPDKGQITRITDTNGDGVAETQTVAVSGLNRPHGMAFHDGWLYVANTDGVVRIMLGADGTAVGTPEQLNHYSGGGGHWTRSIIFGPDGKMYVSIGSSCNLCVEQDSDRAAVMQYDADGKNGRIFARGLRNAVGMAVEPTTGAIWVSQNERDELPPDHQNLPPEEINLLQAGGDYGWPYCYGDRIPNPEYHDPARCAATIPPALEMQAHSAPLGMTFLTNATQLPAEMRGDLALAFHGSWDRAVPTGAKVVRVHVQNGHPVSYDDLIAGWQDSSGNRWGRPVDVAVLHDGSLLVTDDASGEIVRIAARR